MVFQNLGPEKAPICISFYRPSLNTSIARRLSCCISVFAEPTVVKARAEKLEESSRSRRNCKHVYFLLTSTAAVAADMLYSLTADPADAAIMQSQGLFRGSLYRQTEQKQPVAKWVHCDTHMQCYMWSQLLHNHVFTKHGARGCGVRKPQLSWLICCLLTTLKGFPCGSAGKESTCSAGDLGLILGLGRSPGARKGYPL